MPKMHMSTHTYPSISPQLGERQGLLAGLTLGATHLVFNAFYALALWYAMWAAKLKSQ